MNFTYKVYGDRVIGLGYPKFAQAGIEQPPYSPDLNPCDFFLWGYLKDNCYAEKPKTIDDLRKAITKGVLSIKIPCKCLLKMSDSAVTYIK